MGGFLLVIVNVSYFGTLRLIYTKGDMGHDKSDIIQKVQEKDISES